GPRAAPVRVASSGRRAHRAAHRPRPRRGSSDPRPRARSRIRTDRDIATDRGRATVPGPHRGPRGDRATAVRQIGARATAGGRPATRPRAAWDDAGCRPATPVVRATGRPDGTARLAARAARADLWGGSGPACRHHGSGGTAARGPLDVARRQPRAGG